MAPREEPVLAGWVGGPAAQALRGRSEAELIDRALSSLSSLLGLRRSTIVASLVAAYHHDWNEDPFCRGAYAYVGVGGLSAQKTLARPVEDTLILAGEALDADRIGTVEGALQSGRRAARALLKKKTKKRTAAA
jgi:monoamine oxidase